jgi:hypothetical protein
MLIESLTAHPGAWLALVLLGAYHGINPGMGWLFALSNGMQRQRARGVFAALPPLATGHFLAMLAVLLPFAALAVYVTRFDAVRVAAGLLLIAFGLYKLIDRRHPRWLARIGPGHLVTWSFLMATAHGAGLMLAPVYLSLCAGDGQAGMHASAMTLFRASAGLALFAAFVHAVIMIVTAGTIAWLVYRYLGLRLLNRAWVNLDLIWAIFLITAGAIGVAV